MYSLGIAPPTILLSKRTPPVGGTARHAQLDVAVLAAAAGLLDVTRFALRRTADRLAVGHLRLADVGLDLRTRAAAGPRGSPGASSPMPAISVWPVSGSVDCTWNVGSSCTSLARAPASFPGRPWSWARSPGESPAPGTPSPRAATGSSSSQIVSPVDTCPQTHDGGDVAGPDLLDLLALVGVHLEQSPDPLARGPPVLETCVAPELSAPE